MRVLILSHDDVVACLASGACIEVMADVLAARARGEAYMPLRSVMAPPGAAGFFGLMPGWRAAGEHRAEAFGLKAVSVMPGNPARGLDSHQGTVTLFEGETGIPTAILEGSSVTAIRTAAVTAVATRTLAREDAKVLTIIGAGFQARAHIEALASTRPFEEIRIFSPTEAHSRALAEEAAAPPAVGSGAADGAPAPRISAAQSAESAIRGADVVVTATSSRTPVLKREWLDPGAHVNAIGASMPSAYEIDVDTVAASALFCDSRESLANEAGEFRLALEQGAIDGENHVRAELGEVLAGLRPGRLNDTELTLFRSLGIAVEDLAAAQYAVSEAQRLGLGTEVEL